MKLGTTWFYFVACSTYVGTNRIGSLYHIAAIGTIG